MASMLIFKSVQQTKPLNFKKLILFQPYIRVLEVEHI